MSTRPGSSRWLWWYLGLQVPLFIVALASPRFVAQPLWLLTAGLGTAALLVGVVGLRTGDAWGWRFVAAAAVALLVGAVVIGADEAGTGTVQYTSPVPVGANIAAGALLAIGLGMLGRSRRRSDLIDFLDAVIAAGVAFLFLWIFVVEPARVARGVSVVATAVIPIGVLVIFVMVIKILFSRRTCTVSGIFLLVAVAAMLASAVVLLAGAVGIRDSAPGAALEGPTTPLWSATYLMLGVSGLHPSLRVEVSERDSYNVQLTWFRVALFAGLAVLGPLAWILGANETRISADPVGFAVPVSISAVLLLLLVWRLGVTAHVAQARAGALAEQAGALAQAVRDQEALQAQLAYRALHDPLTGLPNRVVLAERLEWTLARQGERDRALIVIDIDGFKDINDFYGYPVGDELLINVAHRLLELAPQQSTLFRLGGDEFAIFMENADPSAAYAQAERILIRTRSSYRIGERDLSLTASIGLRQINADERELSPSTVLRDADLALYAAKQAGKNQIFAFHPALRSAQADHARLSAGLRHALTRREFALRYQPILDLTTEEVVAVEALVRWHPPDDGEVSPAVFIPVAEETGQINAIGAWVVRRACVDARRWYHERGVAVSVNVSGRQLDDPGLADVVLEALRRADLPGRALIVELTETSLIASAQVPHAVAQLKRLRENGVRVAIDDFGTGYSSLAYVSHLPLDIVKIDSSFTQHEGHREFVPENWAFTHAILQLVDGLKLQAIAEGVETPEQARALRALGCPLAQGYLFSRPLPAEEICDLLAAGGPASGAAERAQGRAGGPSAGPALGNDHTRAGGRRSMSS